MSSYHSLGPGVEVMPRTRRDHGCDATPPVPPTAGGSGGPGPAPGAPSSSRRGADHGCDNSGGAAAAAVRKKEAVGGGAVGGMAGGRRLPQIPKHQSKVTVHCWSNKKFRDIHNIMSIMFATPIFLLRKEKELLSQP